MPSTKPQVIIRPTDSELERWRVLAKQRGISVSTLIRQTMDGQTTDAMDAPAPLVTHVVPPHSRPAPKSRRAPAKPKPAQECRHKTPHCRTCRTGRYSPDA